MSNAPETLLKTATGTPCACGQHMFSHAARRWYVLTSAGYVRCARPPECGLAGAGARK